MSGSGHAVQIRHDARHLTLSGKPTYWEQHGASGLKEKRAFCGVCGSPLFSESIETPGRIMVLAGALDNPSAIHPDRVFYPEQAHHWDNVLVSPKSDPIVDVDFDAIGEKLTQAFLSGDYDLYRRLVVLPISTIPYDAPPSVRKTERELREGFQTIRNSLKMLSITDIHRDVVSVAKLADDWIEVETKSHYLRGAQRVLGPFPIHYALSNHQGEWRITAVRSSSSHFNHFVQTANMRAPHENASPDTEIRNDGPKSANGDQEDE